MNNDLPLLDGWQYLIKGITQPMITTQRVLTLIDEKDLPGWFVTGDIVTNDPNLLLKVFIDDRLVQQISASEAYFFGSKNTQGPPMSFIYGQYSPGYNFPLYGIGMYNLNGYPIRNNFKATVETQLPELFVAAYDIIMIKIYDKKAFIDSYRRLHNIQQEEKVKVDVLAEV